MRLIDAERFEESIDMMCDAGGVLQPVTEAVRQFCKEKVRAEPTIEAELKEAQREWLAKIAVKTGESQGCRISCLECEGINCALHDVIEEFKVQP